MAGNAQLVVVVDDEASIRKAMVRALKALNVRVVSFGSAAECLAYLSVSPCHLLITDIKMPGMDGLELLKQVRNLIPWLPVIMVTGFGDVPLAVKALKMGASDFIEKPLNRDGFLLSVKTLLETSDGLDGLLGQTLTWAERRILSFIMAGHSSKHIANGLHRSMRTVELHRQHIMKKLGVKNVVELVQYINDLRRDPAESPQFHAR
jgi:FixJ family two-component response regulator